MNRTSDGKEKRLFTIELRSKGDVKNMSLDGSEKEMKIEKRMKTAGIIACISAVVFAVPHFWFWFGVPLAYPGDFQTLPHDDILWIVGGFSILAAIYAIALTHSSLVRRLPELIVALPAWFGSIGFTLWGLAFFSVQIQIVINGIQSVPQYAAANTSPNVIWGYYWYSLFIIWGVSLGIAAYYSYRLKKSQKQSNMDGNEEP